MLTIREDYFSVDSRFRGIAYIRTSEIISTGFRDRHAIGGLSKVFEKDE